MLLFYQYNKNLRYILLGLFLILLVAVYQYYLYLDFLNTDIALLKHHIYQSRGRIIYVEGLLDQVQFHSDLSEFETGTSNGLLALQILVFFAIFIHPWTLFFFKNIVGGVFFKTKCLYFDDFYNLHRFENYYYYVVKESKELLQDPNIINYVSWATSYQEKMIDLGLTPDYTKMFYEGYVEVNHFFMVYNKYLSYLDHLSRYDSGEPVAMSCELLAEILCCNKDVLKACCGLFELSEKLGPSLGMEAIKNAQRIADFMQYYHLSI